MASIPMRHPDDRSGERSGRVPISRSTLERINREYLKREHLKREEQVKSHEGQSYKIIDKIWNGIKGGGWRPKPPTVPGGKPPRGSKGTGGKGQGEKGTGGKGEGEKNPSGDAPPPATGGGGDPPEDPSRGGPGGGGDPPEDPTRGGSSSATPGNKSDGIRNVGSGSGVAAFRGYRGPYYRLPPRAEIKALKKQLKEAVDAFNRGSKCFNTSTEQLRAEGEKLKKLFEQYADVVKAGIDSDVAMLNISRENAAELKAIVEELTQAVKFSKTGKSLSRTDFQKFFISHGSKTCRRLTFFALTATAVLFAVGCIDFDPAPFDPKLTKAGKLLYDDYLLGLKVECTSSVSSDKISSLLSGQLDALQSKMMIKRIQEKWSCELAVLPGRDATVKAGIVDVWGKGLKVDVNLPIYDGQQRKIELKKKHIFGSVGGSLGLNGNPLLSLDAKFGTKQLSGGVMVDYDILPGLLRRVALGGVFNLFGLSGSLLMERIINLQAAGQQQVPQPAVAHQVTGTMFVQASEATAVGGEVIYRMEAQPQAQVQVATVAVGLEHQVDSATSVKCKITNQLDLTALIQHKFAEKSVLSLTGMVNIANLEAVPRLGLSFSFSS